MEIEMTEDVFLEYMALDFPNFKVNKCNLAYPTSDFVSSFYSMMLESMTDSGVGRLWDLTAAQSVHVESNRKEGKGFLQHIYSLNLYNAVKYIFSKLNPNVPEFLYSDILMPENTPRRTFVFMSFMLNFFYYFTGFGDDLNNDFDECDERRKKLENLKEEKLQLINKLKEFEQKKTDQAETIKATKAKILKYEALNREKENILKELHAKNELLTADYLKLEKKESSHQEELLQIDNEIKHFESLIVSDPDEATSIYNNYETKKTQCLASMKSLQEQVQISLQKLSVCNRVIELLQSLTNVIARGDGQLTDFDRMDFKELKVCLNDLNGKLSNSKNIESGLTVKLIEKELLVPKLKNESAQLESDQAAIICKGQDRCGMCNEYIRNQEKSYTETSIKIKKDENELEANKLAIDDITNNIKELEEKIKSVDEKTKEQYLWCTNEIKNALESVRKTLNN